VIELLCFAPFLQVNVPTYQQTVRSNVSCGIVFSVSVCVYYCDIHDSPVAVRSVWQIEKCVQQKYDELSLMKIETGMCTVTEETAQSIIIIVPVIIIFIIVIIITNTITTTIQPSACCKWQMFLSQRSSIHVTERALWDKSTNLDNLFNCGAPISGMVKLNKIQCRR